MKEFIHIQPAFGRLIKLAYLHDDHQATVLKNPRTLKNEARFAATLSTGRWRWDPGTRHQPESVIFELPREEWQVVEPAARDIRHKPIPLAVAILLEKMWTRLQELINDPTTYSAGHLSLREL